jgi:hypothetical protein
MVGADAIPFNLVHTFYLIQCVTRDVDQMLKSGFQHSVLIGYRDFS